MLQIIALCAPLCNHIQSLAWNQHTLPICNEILLKDEGSEFTYPTREYAQVITVNTANKVLRRNPSCQIFSTSIFWARPTVWLYIHTGNCGSSILEDEFLNQDSKSSKTSHFLLSAWVVLFDDILWTCWAYHRLSISTPTTQPLIQKYVQIIQKLWL